MKNQEELAQAYKNSLDPDNVVIVFLAMSVLKCQGENVASLSNDDIAHTIEDQLMIEHKRVPSTGEISDIRYMIDHEEIVFLMLVNS